MSKSGKIIISLIAAAVAIQFIPYGKDHTNLPIMSEPQWDSPRTKELFNRACADCHSHETKFNVSVWGIQKKNEGEDAAKEVREGEMPMWIYTIPHPEARLSDTEKQDLINGLEKTFGKEEEEEK